MVNDDIIEAGTGFGTHPHRDMEIISYVVQGSLTHGDSMGNKSTLTRGQVQYMSAGTGVYHSEHNLGESLLRILQIWVLPDQKGHTPNYGEFRLDWKERVNQWLHIVSDKTGNAAIKINQDVNFYVLELDAGNEINFSVGKDRQAYLIQIEGTSLVSSVPLDERDALEITEEEITLKASEKSHYILIEMKKSA